MAATWIRCAIYMCVTFYLFKKWALGKPSLFCFDNYNRKWKRWFSWRQSSTRLCHCLCVTSCDLKDLSTLPCSLLQLFYWSGVQESQTIYCIFIVSCHKWARQTLPMRNGATAGKDCRPSSIYGFIVKTHMMPDSSRKYICCKQIKIINQKFQTWISQFQKSWLFWNWEILLPVSHTDPYCNQASLTNSLS